jgi:F0F1-type ATP synthase assembly protein I
VSEKDDRGQLYRAYAVYSAVALELALGIVAGVLGGRWLDARWGTEPWLMIAGVVAGSVAGFTVLFKTLSHEQKRDEKDPPD